MWLLDKLLTVARRAGFRLAAGDTHPPEPVDSFCTLPWHYLVVTQYGNVKKCCMQWQPISREGSPLSLEQNTLEEIWNSEEMRQVRRDMVAGKPIASCEECYRIERHGGISVRLKENQSWQKGLWNQDHVSIDALKSQAAANDYRLPARPIRMQLHVGNLCNLKCRMCNGASSSRINKDAVHRAWTGLEENDWTAKSTRREHWFQQADILRDNLFRDASQLQHLEFLGGETLMAREVGDILQLLIDAGVSESISLQFTTNATTTGAPWLALTERFAHTRFAVSMDGFGAYHEYIRYPSRWPTTIRNIEVLRHLPRASAHAHVTLQNCNALNLSELFRFLDSIDLEFSAYPLQEPRFLGATVLPPRARKLAAQRLHTYGDEDCRPVHKDLAHALAAGLEAAGDTVDLALLRDFMLFTNDLDATRGQNFRQTHAELLPYFEEIGLPWTAERRFAAPGVPGRTASHGSLSG